MPVHTQAGGEPEGTRGRAIHSQNEITHLKHRAVRREVGPSTLRPHKVHDRAAVDVQCLPLTSSFFPSISPGFVIGTTDKDPQLKAVPNSTEVVKMTQIFRGSCKKPREGWRVPSSAALKTISRAQGAASTASCPCSELEARSWRCHHARRMAVDMTVRASRQPSLS